MLLQELIKSLLTTAEFFCLKLTDEQIMSIVLQVKEILYQNGLQDNSPADIISDMGGTEIQIMVSKLKRKEILEKHGSSITWEKNRNRWRIRIPLGNDKYKTYRSEDKKELEDILIEYCITKERSERDSEKPVYTEIPLRTCTIVLWNSRRHRSPQERLPVWQPTGNGSMQMKKN